MKLIFRGRPQRSSRSLVSLAMLFPLTRSHLVSAKPKSVLVKLLLGRFAPSLPRVPSLPTLRSSPLPAKPSPPTSLVSFNLLPITNTPPASTACESPLCPESFKKAATRLSPRPSTRKPLLSLWRGLPCSRRRLMTLPTSSGGWIGC